jgi:hypothetical protein
LRLRLWREGASEDTAQDAGTRDRAPIRAPAPIAGKGWGCDRGQQDNDQQLFQLFSPPCRNAPLVSKRGVDGERGDLRRTRGDFKVKSLPNKRLS